MFYQVVDHLNQNGCKETLADLAIRNKFRFFQQEICITFEQRKKINDLQNNNLSTCSCALGLLFYYDELPIYLST